MQSEVQIQLIGNLEHICESNSRTNIQASSLETLPLLLLIRYDNVPQSIKSNLTAVLKQISNILSDNNPNNDESACGRFDAFINQVDAAERRNDDTLTAEQADDLRTQAEDIRDELLDC